VHSVTCLAAAVVALARPLRRALAGGVYHVTVRGKECERLYGTKPTGQASSRKQMDREFIRDSWGIRHGLDRWVAQGAEVRDSMLSLLYASRAATL
jgi:hypothetical protein